MATVETIRESVVIRVDFVRAGEAHTPRFVEGGAKVIDFAEARLARAKTRPSRHVPHRPIRPSGGIPGGYGGPF